MTDAPPPFPSSSSNSQPTAYNGAAGTPATGEDPGRTLGIVSLILAFFVAIAGLIVGIIARKKSKEAGFENGFAKWGIILSIVFMVLGLIASIAAVALVLSGAALFGGAIDGLCAGYDAGTYETTTGEIITCP